MGEVLQVNTGCIVAFDESVAYDIEMVGGIKIAIFGGEGLFLATLTGPGRVVIQSMTLNKLRRELAPTHHGGDEPKGRCGFSNNFSTHSRRLFLHSCFPPPPHPQSFPPP